MDSSALVGEKFGGGCCLVVTIVVDKEHLMAQVGFAQERLPDIIDIRTVGTWNGAFLRD